MEKKTSTEMIIKTLVNLGVFLIVLSFASPLIKYVKDFDQIYFCCFFCFYFFTGIISIVIALIYAKCNTCKSEKQKSTIGSSEKTQGEKDEEYHREKEKLSALRKHEERMAVIKVLGANYDKKNTEAIQTKLDEIIKTLNSIKQS